MWCFYILDVFNFQVPYALHYNSDLQLVYFLPHFEDHFFVVKEFFFQKILSLCMVSVQDWFVVSCDQEPVNYTFENVINVRLKLCWPKELIPFWRAQKVGVNCNKWGPKSSLQNCVIKGPSVGHEKNYSGQLVVFILKPVHSWLISIFLGIKLFCFSRQIAEIFSICLI